ncbi:hypothetical protein GEMRC1_001994 [Eukaryota sp. GEM-RC1]
MKNHFDVLKSDPNMESLSIIFQKLIAHADRVKGLLSLYKSNPTDEFTQKLSSVMDHMFLQELCDLTEPKKLTLLFVSSYPTNTIVLRSQRHLSITSSTTEVPVHCKSECGLLKDEVNDLNEILQSAGQNSVNLQLLPKEPDKLMLTLKNSNETITPLIFAKMFENVSASRYHKFFFPLICGVECNVTFSGEKFQSVNDNNTVVRDTSTKIARLLNRRILIPFEDNFEVQLEPNIENVYYQLPFKCDALNGTVKFIDFKFDNSLFPRLPATSCHNYSGVYVSSQKQFPSMCCFFQPSLYPLLKTLK